MQQQNHTRTLFRKVSVLSFRALWKRNNSVFESWGSRSNQNIRQKQLIFFGNEQQIIVLNHIKKRKTKKQGRTCPYRGRAVVEAEMGPGEGLKGKLLCGGELFSNFTALFLEIKGVVGKKYSIFFISENGGMICFSFLVAHTHTHTRTPSGRTQGACSGGIPRWRTRLVPWKWVRGRQQAHLGAACGGKQKMHPTWFLEPRTGRILGGGRAGKGKSYLQGLGILHFLGSKYVKFKSSSA